MRSRLEKKMFWKLSSSRTETGQMNAITGRVQIEKSTVTVSELLPGETTNLELFSVD